MAPTELRRPRARLAVRMGLWLVLGSAAILALSAFWNLRLQRAYLTQLVGLSADRIAETIRRSTHDAMLRNDRDGLHRMIATIGAGQGIARVRVFNKEGRIRTSTAAEEVGQLVDKSAEQCYACHQLGRPLARLERADRVRMFRDGQGRRVLGVIAPIHNEPACGACHPAGQQVLGVLDVQLSMAGVDEAVSATERQWLFTLALSVSATALLAGLLLWRLVLAPVSRLELAMGRLAQGEDRAHVPVPDAPADELGRLGRAWNDLTDELGRARSELEGWNRSLEERVHAKTAELERSHERLLRIERMASLGRLAAVVAHEINNPLAGIRTFARLLQRRAGQPADAEETRHILEMVESEAARCGEIVRNLLLFSRDAAARFAVQDPGVLLERTLLLLRHQAELLGVVLELQPSAGLPPVECDGAQVQQLLMALVVNALEATPPGGRVTLSASALPAEAAVALRVEDTGCGIPEAERERIFEPFYTTKTEGKGVGLGLAVVHGIVERHHGRIEVLGRDGPGSIFAVWLPTRQPPGPVAPQEGVS